MHKTEKTLVSTQNDHLHIRNCRAYIGLLVVCEKIVMPCIIIFSPSFHSTSTQLFFCFFQRTIAMPLIVVKEQGVQRAQIIKCVQLHRLERIGAEINLTNEDVIVHIVNGTL